MEARTVSGLPTAAPHHDVVHCLLAIELSKSSWIVAVHAPLSDRISRYMLEGCDWKGLPELIERIRKRVTREFGPSVEMILCYEASYDVARQSGCVPYCRIRECSPADRSLPHSNVPQPFLLASPSLRRAVACEPAVRPPARDGGPPNSLRRGLSSWDHHDSADPWLSACWEWIAPNTIVCAISLRQILSRRWRVRRSPVG